MNEMTLSLIDSAIRPEDMERFDTPALKAELAKALTMSAKHLAYLGMIWSELERRGEDLSDLRSGLAVYLPLIGAGQLDPDVVVKFAGQKTLLRAISSLPIREQQRIAQGGTIQILGFDPEGRCVSRQLPVQALTAAQVRQAFGDGRIRGPEEQRVLLESTYTVAVLKPKPTAGAMKFDRSSGRFKVGRTSISVGEILEALAVLSKPVEEIPEDEQAKLMVTVSRDELKAIKIHAAEGESNMQRLVRGLLAAHGVLSRV